MRFTEVNLLGVYVAPIAPMMLAAWLLIPPLRWIGGRIGLRRVIWHPALFSFALYVIVLACIVQVVAAMPDLGG